MRLPTAVTELVALALSGDRRALARVLSITERGGPGARRVGTLVFDQADGATTVGITGAPGAGKSTLTNALVAHMRTLLLRTAVLAIDPSSPFSGGAILGDRVRMGDHVLDPDVYIRSLATRGHLGGLALAVPESIRVLAAAKFAWVLVETVGVGQVEVEIVEQADTTVVVVNPGWGDAVQANKAGLMEIADVFVINKADRDGVRQTRHDLKAMVEMGDTKAWTPPIVETVAIEGSGADELWGAIQDHQAHLSSSGERTQRRQNRRSDELQGVITERLRQQAETLLASGTGQSLRARVLNGDLSPYDAADEILGLPKDR